MTTKMREQLIGLGFEVTKKGAKTVAVTATLGAARRFLEDAKKLDWRQANRQDALNAYLGDKYDPNMPSDFRGGRMRDLQDDLEHGPDMARFEEAFKQFADKKLTHELQTALQDIMPKRKRRFSEHDGEWTYDRRFEISPFQATTKILAPARVVRIKAGFSIAGVASAEAIDSYGAMVWAVSQLIERAGIQTEIVWVDGAQDCDSSLTWQYEIEMQLKKAGQYLAPTMLAACFSTRFYRRLGFAMQTATLNAMGVDSSFSLGGAIRHPNPVEFRNGELLLTPDCIRGYDEQLKQAIIKAIKGE